MRKIFLSAVRVVASSHGNQATQAEVNGRSVVIGVNAYLSVK
jgi:hypothetical protein